MWYFPISMSKSKKSISNSIFFTAKFDEVSYENYIVTVCETGTDPVLYIKPIVLYFWTVAKHVQYSFICMITKSTTWRVYNFLKNRKCPMGSSLYNSLYWNDLRYESFVVLKIISNISLTSISILSCLLHLFKHLGISLFLTRRE